MSTVKSFKDLFIWQDAMDLVKSIYNITNEYPEVEKFNLTSQTTRSAISVPSNIAEGFGRKSNKDFTRFLQIALGSLFELQTQLIIAHSQNYISEMTFKTIEEKVETLGKRINSFKASLAR